MSQDSIGVVTTGRGKLQEWKTTQKQNLSRKSRGTLTVKWAGSRDKIFSPSGRERTFFLTSLPRNKLKTAPLLLSGGRAWPASFEASEFVVGVIGFRSTQSLCRRIVDHT